MVGGEGAGGVDERLGVFEVDEFLDFPFVAHFEEIIEKFGLFLFDEFGNGDSGGDVAESVVGGVVGDFVKFGDELETIGGFAVFVGRPIDAFGAESASNPDDIEQIPAATTIFPLPFVGIIEVAPK